MHRSEHKIPSIFFCRIPVEQVQYYQIIEAILNHKVEDKIGNNKLIYFIFLTLLCNNYFDLYRTGAYMKFAWKLHASQLSFNLLGFPCGVKPLFMYPDCLQMFTALSLPDRSEATEAYTTVSSPTKRLPLFAKIGWMHSCLPAR